MGLPPPALFYGSSCVAVVQRTFSDAFEAEVILDDRPTGHALFYGSSCVAVVQRTFSDAFEAEEVILDDRPTGHAR